VTIGVPGVALGIAVESDAALAITVPNVLHVAIESDVALPLVVLGLTPPSTHTVFAVPAYSGVADIPAHKTVFKF
jgi:hypothetical protein